LCKDSGSIPKWVEKNFKPYTRRIGLSAVCGQGLLLLLTARQLMHRMHCSLRLIVQPQYFVQHTVNNPAPRMKRQKSLIEDVLMSFGSTIGFPKTLCGQGH
jgi:hypothetical protein